MKILKRSGAEEVFDITKIIAAIQKANNTVSKEKRLNQRQIVYIAETIEDYCKSMTRASSVEEIQDMVEEEIMKQSAYNVAKNYIKYRYKRAMVRHSNTTDEQILSLLEFDNEEVKQELYGRRSQQGHHKAFSPPRGRSAGTRRGYNPLPRCRLFCSAYAQLLSCQP